METLEKFNNSIFNSVGFKLTLIGGLTLLLLIPAQMILSLIREREQRRIETIDEVTSSWGKTQTITGPVLTIPYKTMAKNNNHEYVTRINYAHILPDELQVTGTIEPEVRYRGIYKVVTYSTRLHFSGSFKTIDLQELGISSADMEEDKVFVEVGIPDMRGINKDIRIKWGDSLTSIIPGLTNDDLSGSGVHAKVEVNDKDTVDFSFDLDLNGSHSLNFVPVGKITNVTLTSLWNSPSFCGAFLPDDRKVDNRGFSAHWNILQLNRNYPQQWKNDQYAVLESAFGVELITPVDAYHKSERSVKYAILFITLTFVIFFFAEVMNKNRIHAINYLLTGIALCVFYSLLTALCEHISFTWAYLIAGFTIIAMIGTFAHSLYKKWLVTLTVVATLGALYTFLFVILQLTDYSLLIGNIGLVIVLAIIMYFSRKINWYSQVRNDS